jgi:catechol 2,3-dioxygenase-like lactoylglutathione lyase family enzyme
MGAKLSTIVVDCSDPVALSGFWSEVLGWHEVGREDDGAIEIGPDDQHVITLLFEPVADPKRIKNRLHLDLNPLNADQGDERRRITALGARPVDIGQGDPTWVVFVDPEGNEFCLLRTRVDG